MKELDIGRGGQELPGKAIEIVAANGFVAIFAKRHDGLDAVAHEAQAVPRVGDCAVERAGLAGPIAPGAVIAFLGVRVDDQDLAVAQRAIDQLASQTQASKAATGEDEIIVLGHS